MTDRRRGHPDRAVIHAYIRDVVRPALDKPPTDHHHDAMTSLRQVEYNGHRIRIETTYRVTVDGRSVTTMVQVDNDGQLSCHVLPNYSFISAVDLVKQLIDAFPENFASVAPHSGH